MNSFSNEEQAVVRRRTDCAAGGSRVGRERLSGRRLDAEALQEAHKESPELLLRLCLTDALPAAHAEGHEELDVFEPQTAVGGGGGEEVGLRVEVFRVGPEVRLPVHRV